MKVSSATRYPYTKEKHREVEIKYFVWQCITAKMV
jgi:hypothetical protein